MQDDDQPPREAKPLPQGEQGRSEYYGFCSKYTVSDAIFHMRDVPHKDSKGRPVVKYAHPTCDDVIFILQNYLPNYLGQLKTFASQDPDFPRGVEPRFKLILDNATWHAKERLIPVLLKLKTPVELVAFPTYSSDLNVQEQVWRSLDARMDKATVNSVDHMFMVLNREYNIVAKQDREQQTFARLCRTYAARAQQCIDRKGGKTKF